MLPESAPRLEAHAELALRAGLGAEGSATDLDRLVAVARVVALEPGQLLCEAGHAVDCVYQLETGTLDVTFGDDVIALAPYGTVGVVDLLQKRPHSQTVRATSATRLLEISADDYLELLADNFELSLRMIAGWAGELVDHMLAAGAATPMLAAEAPPGPRRYTTNVEVSVVDRIVLLGNLAVFRGATTQALANLAAVATERRCETGEAIVRRDTPRDTLSILVDGEVTIEAEGVRATRACIDLLTHVHELHPRPRFDVTATRPVLLLEIAREDLTDQMEEHFDLASSVLGELAATRAALNLRSAVEGSAEPCPWC